MDSGLNLSLLHKYRLCFDKLTTNGKKFNDFNICSVYPEPWPE